MVDLPESCYRPPAYREFPERHAPGVRALLYDSLPYRARPTRVFAWVGVPGNASSAHPVPGMVLVHGGLGTAFPGWVRYWNNLGYAAIAMDTCGAMPPQDQLDVRGCGEGNHWPAHADGGPAGWGNFDRATAAVEEQWCFHALAAVIEAHSLLRSLPGVDPEKIGITGVSWGGCSVVWRREWMNVSVLRCRFTGAAASIGRAACVRAVRFPMRILPRGRNSGTRAVIWRWRVSRFCGWTERTMRRFRYRCSGRRSTRTRRG